MYITLQCSVYTCTFPTSTRYVKVYKNKTHDICSITLLCVTMPCTTVRLDSTNTIPVLYTWITVGLLYNNTAYVSTQERCINVTYALVLHVVHTHTFLAYKIGICMTYTVGITFTPRGDIKVLW